MRAKSEAGHSIRDRLLEFHGIAPALVKLVAYEEKFERPASGR